jgi:hypothetical protein
MQFVKSLVWAIGLLTISAIALVNSASAAGFVKLSGTRFTMEVPAAWEPGYKDVDNKMLMIYFTRPKTDTALEGVYLRKVQDASFSLADFKKWRIEAEGKRYAGKDFKVLKEGELSIGGEKGNFLETAWRDGGKHYVKYTAQYLKDGGQYMVVLHGVVGKVNKKVFDHAVKTFAVAASK